MTKSCSEFLQKAGNLCVICSSIKEEAIRLIDDSYSTIVSDFQSNLKPFLEQQNVKELSNRDGRILATFFSDRKKALQGRLPYRSRVGYEILGAIEHYVASSLHSLKDGFKIKSGDFLAAMITELTLIVHELKAPFSSLKQVDITPEDSTISFVAVSTLIANPSDIRHLSSALKYQFQRDEWIIFVTTDETDILSKEKEIFNIFALQCSKPEWAFDYHREITKQKSPIEYYREIDNYSSRQKEFGDVIEKTLGIKILS